MTARSGQNQITTVQAALIVFSTIVGAGIMTLPRDAGKAVGSPDAWIAVILGGTIALGFGYVVAKLSQRFPGHTIYQYSQTIIGTFLGKIHGVVLIVYFTCFCGWQVRSMAELVRLYLLDNTPIEVIIVVFMWLAAYLVDGGIRSIGRICELYFPIVAVILLLTFTLSWHFLTGITFDPFWEKDFFPCSKESSPLPLLLADTKSCLF